MEQINLSYGNPTMDIMQGVLESELLRDIIKSGMLNNILCHPAPSIDDTIIELDYLRRLSYDVDSSRLEKIKAYENDYTGEMIKFLDSYGIKEEKEVLDQQLALYRPIENYLKIKYNRARPFQAAHVLGIGLYPLLKTDASTASYPGGHTLHAMWFRHIIMKKHPEIKKELMDFALDVKLSREEGGVHYPSDGTFSILVYHRIKDFVDNWELTKRATPTTVVVAINLSE